MINEEWKVISFDNRYYISNEGRVKKITTKGEKIIKGSILKTGGGYRYFQLQRNGKRINLLFHRLVAISFIPNPENKPIVDHIDRNPLNNNVKNLRWCTQNENTKNQTPPKNSEFKLQGVRFDKTQNVWCAYISNKFLGYFKTCEEAIQCREEAEKKIYGVFKPNINRIVPENAPIGRDISNRAKKGSLTKQMIRERDRINALNLRKKNILEKKYYCYDCEHSFGCSTDLKDHYNSINHLCNVIPFNLIRSIYICNYCKKELKKNKTLKNHINKFHSSPKNPHRKPSG